jgi:NADPH:quinone reductase-like Zn-dependent oxidoreductase
MKAFYLTSYGGSESSVYGELPDRVMSKKQLLIEVKAVSINPVDYKVKSGDLKILSGSKFPKIIGTDYAGIVRTAGSETTGFKTGDRVYGAVSIIFGKPGTFSELIAINPKNARLIPEGMSFEEAASLPVAALTALNGLRKCKAGPGKQILINGATGGVGHFAVQIAKAKGASVTATCSEANALLAKSLGADEITGYRREDIAGSANKYDAILDAYGKMEYKDVCRLLKRKGTYASTLFFAPTSFISAILVQIVFRKKLTSSNMRSRPEDYDEIENLFRQKKMIPLIENRFSLEKADEAFEVAEIGKPRGKVVVTI